MLYRKGREAEQVVCLLHEAHSLIDARNNNTTKQVRRCEVIEAQLFIAAHFELTVDCADHISAKSYVFT